jgi:hypothetical protein
MLAGTVRFTKLLRNWGWVYLGNLLGSLLYAGLFYLAITNWRTGNGGAVADLLKQAAQKKTLGFAALGGSGWALALVKGILCNWMVTIGAMLAVVSRSTFGKIAAMWLPIMTFRARVRAFRRQHVYLAVRYDAGRGYFHKTDFVLESPPRHAREHPCRGNLHRCAVMRYIRLEPCSNCKLDGAVCASVCPLQASDSACGRCRRASQVVCAAIFLPVF